MKHCLYLRLLAAAATLMLFTKTLSAQSEICPPDRLLGPVVGSSININTGVDENLNVLPFGALDPRWTLVSSTLPPMRIIDRWNFTPVASRWIGFAENQNSSETNYQVRFDFCTEQCGDYRLNFRMLADNGACVYLDGVLVPSSWWLGNVPIPDCNFNPGDQSPFIPTAGYVIDHTLYLSGGVHTLEIDVTNFQWSLTSINVQGSIELQEISTPCIVGVDDSDAPVTDVQLFPNPAQDLISVYWKNETPLKLYLVDVLGRNFRTLEVPANGEHIDISLEGLQPGTYFLVWQDRSGRTFSRRFVKI
jgi:Secretion system C-terminal sorting domain